MATIPQPDSSNIERPFISHLIELRDRLLRVIMVAGVALVALYPFANILYGYVAAPLMAQLPNGAGMIVTGVAAPFMVPFKLTLMIAVALTIPYTLHQLWSFVAPGLYHSERRLAVPLLVSSVLLFYIGMAFAYFVVFPLMFSFFVTAAPKGVAVMTDIGEYLDFVLTLFFAFGAAFEVPIATILLVWMGIITPKMLVGKRPHIIVGAFVIGMFLTPPDAFSQILIALPMWLLFEAGVFFSRYFIPPAATDKSDSEPAKSETVTTPEPPPSKAQAVNTTDLDSDIFQPLTDMEMEAELDELDAMDMLEHQAAEPVAATDQVDHKLAQIHALRQAEDEAGARTLLYQVLIEGNAQQRLVAQNILEQLDL